MHEIPPRPPPARRREPAEAFHRRDEYLAAVVHPAEEWPDRHLPHMAYMAEQLGLSPEQFGAILGLAHRATDSYLPAGLEYEGYLFRVCPPDRVHGRPLGAYRGWAIVARTVTPR
ncbi:hypothetical protein WDZ92_16240 [Nostoc sp. NIES-2111]